MILLLYLLQLLLSQLSSVDLISSYHTLPSAIWEIFSELPIFCNLFHELLDDWNNSKIPQTRKVFANIALGNITCSIYFIVKCLLKLNMARVSLLHRAWLIQFIINLLLFLSERNEKYVAMSGLVTLTTFFVKTYHTRLSWRLHSFRKLLLLVDKTGLSP